MEAQISETLDIGDHITKLPARFLVDDTVLRRLNIVGLYALVEGNPMALHTPQVWYRIIVSKDTRVVRFGW